MNENLNCNNNENINNLKPIKNKKSVDIVLILCALIALFIIGFTTYKVFISNKENNNGLNKENNSIQKDEKKDEVKKESKDNNKEKQINNGENTSNENKVIDDHQSATSLLSEEEKSKVLFDEKTYSLNYKLTGNTLENFDLYFMKMENNKKNKVYSPLSIKYALEMLSEGANGNSKEQIDAVIGDYKGKKYTNNKNMSFANALFIRDTKKDNIKSSYIDTLKNKYNAEVVYDSFSNPNNINKWISDKTLNLIPNLIYDVSKNDFILTNALAIDMEWANKIQSINDDYHVIYEHQTEGKNYSPTFVIDDEASFTFVKGIAPISRSYDLGHKFEGVKDIVASLEIGAVANKYDLVNEVGEENIRKTVTKEYDKWINGRCKEVNSFDTEYCDTLPKEYDIDKYIKELNSNYKDISSSTDFEFYDDDDVKIFAKDLKKYNGTTLEYIGIMPKQDNLEEFINNTDSSRINSYINSLNVIELDSFDDKYITVVEGKIPVFKFDYELNLMEDLKKLKIEDVFDTNKADLSNLTSDKNVYIDTAVHKSNIEFSNNGIKASATTGLGGSGAIGAVEFDYLYNIPVKRIDLTFNRPYMFIIRDKDSGEVWFIGTVYEPIKWSCEYYYAESDNCEY